MAERDRTTPSNAALQTLVRSGPETPGRSEAFAELVSREPRGLTRFLSDLALDPHADRAIRAKAVAALGRKPTPAALDALRSALAADDEVVVQRAIERLGKIGAPQDLDQLRGIRTGNRTSQRALRTAKCFLSYRHRLGDYRFDAPKQRLRAAGDDATEIRTGAPTQTMLDRMELAPPRVPGIPLDPRPARRLVCAGQELALMLSRDLAGAAAATLAERQGVPAVLVRYDLETGGYDPAYYLVTDPVRRGAFRIAGVRGSGRLGLDGTGTVDDGAVTFELGATELPAEHPLTVRGTYDLKSGALRLDVAISERRFSERQQRRRRQPRLVRSPER